MMLRLKAVGQSGGVSQQFMEGDLMRHLFGDPFSCLGILPLEHLQIPETRNEFRNRGEELEMTFLV